MDQARVLSAYVYVCALIAAGKAACPMKCWCGEKKVECSANMDEEFPFFPPDTEEIVLSQLNVRYMPVNAFKDLPNLRKIHITNSNIAEFQSCSLSGLSNLTEIIVDKSAIGNIESYAFMGLTNIGELRFENCRVGRMKPFGFYDISNITILNMINVHMRNVYSQAFYNVSNIEHIVFHKNNFSDVVTAAFNDLTRGSQFEAYENKFWNLQCGNIDDLMRATGSFYFDKNTFYCNCSVSWLLSDNGRSLYDTLLSQSSCHGPDDMINVTSLKSVKFSDLKCTRLTQSSPAQCGVYQLVPKPKCPERGQPSIDVIEENKKDTKDPDDSSVVQQTNFLLLIGLILMNFL